MRINNNLMAMNTHRQLGMSNAAGSRSMEKLSSGFRINRAGDDAAGLSISEKMRAQIRGLGQASRNSQDAISLIQTAEGALGETQSILQRMRELAVQAASDTNVTVDRDAIQNELNQLTSEINRIGNTTEFNTQKLLNGGSQAVGAVALGTVTPYGTTPATGTVTGLTAGAATETVAYDAGGVGAAAATLTIGGGDGLTITAAANGTAGNAYTVEVVQGAAATGVGAETASSIVVSDTGVVTITLGTTWDGSASVNTALSANDIAALIPSGDGAALVNFTVAGDGSGNIAVVGAANLAGGDNGTAATPAEYEFSIGTNFAVGDSITVAGQTLTFIANGGTAGAGEVALGTDSDGTAAALAAALTTTGFTVTASSNVINFEQSTAGTGAAPTVSVSGPGATAASTTFTLTAALAEGETLAVGGLTFEAVAAGGSASGSNVAIDLGTASTAADQMAIVAGATYPDLTVTYTAGDTSMTIAQTAAGTGTIGTPTVSAAGGSGFQATMQIGANTAQSFAIDILDMRAAALNVSGTNATTVTSGSVTARYTATDNVTDGTDNVNTEAALDISTHDNATAAITIINDAIESVSAERSKLGAFQNRLESTIRNLNTSSENLQASEARIRDVDMAAEMMEFTKNNILNQAATAMLAQANQAPQAVLQLLR